VAAEDSSERVVGRPHMLAHRRAGMVVHTLAGQAEEGRTMNAVVAQQTYAVEEDEGRTHAVAAAHRLGEGAGEDTVAEAAGHTQVADAEGCMQVEVVVEHTLTGAGADMVAEAAGHTQVADAGVDMLVEAEPGHTLTGVGVDMVAAADTVAEEGTRTLGTEVPHRLAAVAEQGQLVPVEQKRQLPEEGQLPVEQKRQLPEEGQQPSSVDLGATMKRKETDHLRKGIATQNTYSSEEQCFLFRCRNEGWW
jgi:hypothetical protein